MFEGLSTVKSHFPVSFSARFLCFSFRWVTIFESFRFLMGKISYKAGFVGNFKRTSLKLQGEDHMHCNKTAFETWVGTHLGFQKRLHCCWHAGWLLWPVLIGWCFPSNSSATPVLETWSRREPKKKLDWAFQQFEKGFHQGRQWQNLLIHI